MNAEDPGAQAHKASQQETTDRSCLSVDAFRQRMDLFHVHALAQASNIDCIKAIEAIERALHGKTHIYFAKTPLQIKSSSSSVAANFLLNDLHKINLACMKNLKAEFSYIHGFLDAAMDIAQYDPNFAGSFKQFKERIKKGQLADHVVADMWLLSHQADQDQADQAQEATLRKCFQSQKTLQQKMFDPSGSYFRMLSALGPGQAYMRFVQGMSRQGLERQLLFRDMIKVYVVLSNSEEVRQSVHFGGPYQALRGELVSDFLKSDCFKVEKSVPWDERDAHAWSIYREDDLRCLFPWSATEADLRDSGEKKKFLSWPLPLELKTLASLSDFRAAYLNQAEFSNWLGTQALWFRERFDFVQEYSDKREREVGGYTLVPGAREQHVQDFIAELKRHQRTSQVISALLASLIVVPEVQRCKYCYRRTTDTPKGARRLLVCDVHKKIYTHKLKSEKQVSEKTRLRQVEKIGLMYRNALKVLQATLQQNLATKAGQKGLQSLSDLERDVWGQSVVRRRKLFRMSVCRICSLVGNVSADRMHALAQYICEQSLLNEQKIQPNKESADSPKNFQDEKDKRTALWNETMRLPSFFRLYFSGVAGAGAAFAQAPDALKVPIDVLHPSKHWELGDPDVIPPEVYLDYKSSVSTLLTDLLAHEAWIEVKGPDADASLGEEGGLRLLKARSRILEPYQDCILALRKTLVPTRSGSKSMSFAKIAEHIARESNGDVNVSKAAVQQEFELAMLQATAAKPVRPRSRPRHGGQA